MTSTTTVPTPRRLRIVLRRARRPHRRGGLGDLLTDVYLLVLLVAVYGSLFGGAVRDRFAGNPPIAGPAGSGPWLAAAVVLVLTGAAWHTLRGFGPVLVRPATMSWVLSGPVDRTGWLRPALAGLLAGGVAGGAVLAAVAGWLAGTAQPWWHASTGGCLGAALVAAAVMAQAGDVEFGRVADRLAPTLAVTGAVVGAVVVVAAAAGMRLPEPRLPVGAAIGPALVLAALLVVPAWRSIGRLRRRALTGGVRLADAVVTAGVFMDVSLLTGVLEARRWQRSGRVRSRRWRPGHRTVVLVQAELRRQARRPATLAGWAGLALLPYLSALVLPESAGEVRVVAGYLAAGRLAAGLRTVGRSAALRRMLGGRDRDTVAAHLVLPAVGLAVWWVLTGWAGAPTPPVVEVLLAAGVLAALYRSARRPPIAYDGAVVDTPFGLIPVGLLHQVLRGPDLVIVLVLVQTLVS